MDAPILHLYKLSLSLAIFCNTYDAAFTSEDKFKVESVCSSYSFIPKCDRPGQAVVMVTARYGRMQLGDCVKDNLGFQPCVADVLSIADRCCSGRQKCEIRVTNLAMDEVAEREGGCSSELSQYLEVNYTCVTVKSIPATKCGSSQQIDVKAVASHLSSIAVNASTCRDVTSPWQLSVLPGQRIQLSLVDMWWTEKTTISHTENVCILHYGYVQEGNMRTKMPICGGKEKLVELGLSAGHQISLYLNRSAVMSRAFLIRYQAVGCADLVAPPGGWLKRYDDEMTFGCNGTEHTWHLRCQGNHWEGVIGNCSQHTQPVKASYSTGEGYKYSAYNGLVIALVLALSLVLSALIVLAGALWYRRYYVYEKPKLPRASESESYQCFLGSNRSAPPLSSHSYRHPCPPLPDDRMDGSVIYPVFLEKENRHNFCPTGSIHSSDTMSICQIHGAI